MCKLFIQKAKKLLMSGLVLILVSLLVPSFSKIALAGEALQAVRTPFTCSGEAYLFKGSGGFISAYELNLVTGNLTKTKDFSRKINGIGYNITDGYIWGYDTINFKVVQIDSNYIAIPYTIPGLPNLNYYVGDVSPDGKLYLKVGNLPNTYVIDVNPVSITYLSLIDTISVPMPTIADWAFNPADGFIYAATIESSISRLYRINPTTGQTTNLGIISGLTSPSTTYGASYFDTNGNFYIGNNTDGKIYRIPNVALNNTAATFFAQALPATGNDGARCINAPILIDLGDAPDSYGTTIANDGPRHSMPTQLFLGFGIDPEDDASQPLDGTSDAFDDGVAAFSTLETSSTSYSVEVVVSNNQGSPANLIGWVDFNRNGTFDTDEKASFVVPTGSLGTVVTLTWPSIPNDINPGNTFARFRLTTDSVASTNATGGASDGEVEDYPNIIIENSFIGVAKRVSNGPFNNADGTYTLSFDILVENESDVDFSNLQVVDNLAATFAGATFTLDAVASADFTLNPSYDGSVDINLLDGSDNLSVGNQGSIKITLTVTPGANLGTYLNSAMTSATTERGFTTTDTSADGTDPDPDGDKDPTNNNTPTPVLFDESPLIGAAKNISVGPVNNGDGTYILTYSILARNMGGIILSNVQITEDLATTFTTATSFSIDSVTSSDFTLNTSFDGDTDIELLTGTDSLVVGDTGIIDIIITITPGAYLGPYENTARASGTAPSGAFVGDITQDDTTDGGDPDPDGDGDPTNNNTPTTFILDENAQIGVAKRVSNPPLSNGDGTYDLSYEIYVENNGEVGISDLQVQDDFSLTYPAPVLFTIISVTSSDFSVNAAYDGNGDINMLDGTDTIAINTSGTILIELQVAISSVPGPYLNSAIGSGDPPSGATVLDVSHDGTDPDPDEDGDPINNNTPTLVVFPPAIGSIVWHDADLDGIRDPSEPLLDGITVNLRDPNTNALLETMVTANGGIYHFANLIYGDYVIEVIPPTGYSFTTQFVGSNTQIDSNIDPLTGISAVITLSQTNNELFVDAGLLQNISLINKSLVSTDQSFTTGNDVTIGEILTYSVVINIPAGGQSEVTLTDTLDDGLAFVRCVSLTPSNATDLVTDHLNGFSDTCDPAQTDPTGNPNVANNGRIVTWDMGFVMNNSSTSQMLTVIYEAVVLDIASNISNVSLNNSVSSTWAGSTLTSQSPEVTILVTELGIDKTANPENVIPGTVVTYTLVLNHTSLSEVDTFDMILTDQLPSGLTYVSGSLQHISGPVPTLLDDTNEPTLTVTWDSFPLGQLDSVIEYQVVVSNIRPGQDITNTAKLMSTSLPGDFLTTPLSPYNPDSLERWYAPPITATLTTYGPSATISRASLTSLPSVGFTPAQITELPIQSPNQQYIALGSIWLEIPSLGLQLPIMGVPIIENGWDVSWLSGQAGYLEGTAKPGNVGNTVLTAHVYGANGLPGPFVNLRNLKYGEQFSIHAWGQVYTYEVRTSQTVPYWNESVLYKNDGYDWVTLLTCENYSKDLDYYRSRRAVQAVLINISQE